MRIHELAAELNHHSVCFEIGSLQKIRKCLRGLRQVPCRGIFGKQSIKENKDGHCYAFHLGGREEMQFNIGEERIEDVEMIRYGVAFSLELNRTLPRIEPLLPKIRRFNEYVIEHLEDFPDFSMWHHEKNKEHSSEDRPVGQIADALLKSGTFIMLGRRVVDDEVDIRDIRNILADFDRLLPLFVYVESAEQDPPFTMSSDFTPGCPSFIERTTASQTGQTVDVALRHNTLQMELYNYLCREAGDNDVQVERHLPIGVRVDAVVRCNGKEIFYEVKVGSTVRSCVRAALGQLIEYCHWPSANRASEIIVVGEAELDSDSRAYLDFLRQRFDIPLWYRRIDINNNVLERKA